MKGVLSLHREWSTAAPGSDLAGGDAAGALERIARDLTARAAGGDAAASIGLRMIAAKDGAPAAADARDAGSALDEAGRALAAGDPGAAARNAALLLGAAETAADGHLALATIAIETGAYDEAVELANAALRLAPGHPRAHCLIGYCEFVRGNGKAARFHLATTTRLARRVPELRGDQRAAQQLLLLLHLT